MTGRTSGSSFIRKSLALFMCLALAAGAAPYVFAQDPAATIAGIILDPSGKPAFGFKAVVIDTATNTKYTSSPTDAAGNYAIQVPVGGRYKLESVIADDGITKLTVQDVPPVSVLAAGTTSLNVRFTETPAPGTQTATTEEEEKKKKKGALPWYQRPGPIVGMVLGGVAIAALALSGGDSSGNDNTASRSMP